MNSTNKESNQQKGIALIYLRVAAERQTQEKASIVKQQKICLDFAKNQDSICSESADIYADICKSGGTMNRPELKKLLKRCESDKSVKTVIVHDLSRLSRNRIDFEIIRQQLKKSGVKLLSATESIDDTPEGVMLADILSCVAEFYDKKYKSCQCA